MVLSQCGPEEFWFIGGDFNCTENDKIDRNHIEPHAASRRAIKQLVETHSLVDAWGAETVHVGSQHTVLLLWLV